MKQKKHDKINSRTMRVDPSMKKLFKEVRIEKIKTGECNDMKELTDRRLSQAITRIPNIKEVLVRSKIKR